MQDNSSIVSSSSSGPKKRWALTAFFKSAGNSSSSSSSTAAAAAHSQDGHANHKENYEESILSATDNYKEEFAEVRRLLNAEHAIKIRPSQSFLRILNFFFSARSVTMYQAKLWKYSIYHKYVYL